MTRACVNLARHQVLGRSNRHNVYNAPFVVEVHYPNVQQTSWLKVFPEQKDVNHLGPRHLSALAVDRQY